MVQEKLGIFTKDFPNKADLVASSRGRITIPVVVHLVTQGIERGISDEQVHSQITALNRDFNLQNTDTDIVHPDFQNLIANVGFNFCLATVDPDGNPTTGITRRNTSEDNIATPNNTWLYDTDAGGQTAWDTERYLNIWVTQITPGLSGFAALPGQKPPSQDGVVIPPRFFGMGGLATPPFHLGRTGVHEVGHYFNLRHPWNGGCEGTDFVADVPQQLNPYRDCSVENFSCGNRSNAANYMNYRDDDCQAMFTRGQAMRMQAALIGARSGLLHTNACAPPLPTVTGTEIMVYPNPASYYFCVEVGNAATEQIPYVVYDARGAKVEEGIVLPNSRQHFPTYRNGIYFLEFQNGLDEPIIKKMVIHK
ncbi:MAG: M43 family zinc metalloprotease [Bacteroidota bacterium]